MMSELGGFVLFTCTVEGSLSLFQTVALNREQGSNLFLLTKKNTIQLQNIT